jgi:hypothetical protein
MSSVLEAGFPSLQVEGERREERVPQGPAARHEAIQVQVQVTTSIGSVRVAGENGKP